MHKLPSNQSGRRLCRIPFAPSLVIDAANTVQRDVHLQKILLGDCDPWRPRKARLMYSFMRWKRWRLGQRFLDENTLKKGPLSGDWREGVDN